MEFEFILYEKGPKAHIARVTMNRAHKSTNAISGSPKKINRKGNPE